MVSTAPEKLRRILSFLHKTVRSRCHIIRLSMVASIWDLWFRRIYIRFFHTVLLSPDLAARYVFRPVIRLIFLVFFFPRREEDTQPNASLAS